MFPDIASLRALEIDTLRCITELGVFGRLSELQLAARQAITSIQENRGPINIHLGFTLDIRLRADRRKTQVRRRVDIGALVEVASDKQSIRNASYSLTICRGADPRSGSILRKLHFDYEPLSSRNLTEDKPSVHMQVCGKLSPQHRAAGYTDIQLQGLHPGFEKPRIPSMPTSLALMINWILVEFQSDVASPQVLRTPQWRKLVAKAERQVLTQYYKGALAFLTNTDSVEKRFLQTHLYEMKVD
jgi:hypothetical protein